MKKTVLIGVVMTCVVPLYAALPPERERAMLDRAIEAAQCAMPDGELRLNEFLKRYPTSPWRDKAVIAKADILFNRSLWADAYRLYAGVNPRSLDSEDEASLMFHTAYCRLMLGDYEAAADSFSRLERNHHYGAAARFYVAYVAYATGDYRRALTLMRKAKSDTSPGLYAPYYIMQMHFAEGSWRTAADEAVKLLALPSMPESFRSETLRVAGEALYNLGQTERAADYLWQYGAVAGDDIAPSACYILGLGEYRDGNYSEAIKLLQHAAEGEPIVAQGAYFTLGQAYLQRGDTDAAIMAFEQAYRLGADSRLRETAFYNYVTGRVEGGRSPFGNSVGMLEEFLQEYPSSGYAPQVRQYIVAGYMTSNDYNAALDALDRMTGSSPELDRARQRVLLVVASRQLLAGDVNSAEKRLLQLQQMDSGLDPSVLCQSRLWLGDCYYQQGQYSKAATQYSDFLRDTATAAPNYTTACYNLGYALMKQKEYAKAERAFAKINLKKTDNRLKADILNRLGDCAYYTSQFAKAMPLYRRAHETAPATGDYALFRLATTKGLTGDHRGKIADIDRLMADFPGSPLLPDALREKGESQTATGDTAGAIETFTQLTEQYAATRAGRNGMLQLAMLHLNAGSRSKAIDTYKRIITLYPTSDEARMAANDLKHIYSDDGRLDEFARFVNSIEGAPTIDSDEMDNLTFESAEQLYLSDRGVKRLEEYLHDFPGGSHRASAQYYLTLHAWQAGQTSKALRLANELIKSYPHTDAATSALAIKGEAEMSAGKHSDALSSFKALERSASESRLQHTARMGTLRALSALKRHTEAIEAADKMLKSGSVPADDRRHIRYLRAVAMDAAGMHGEADSELRSLASNPDNIFGSMAAVELAGSLLKRNRLKEAASVADDFINANPPHDYWLARGFIVYSDILRAQGDKFKADEYLRSLRNNYPGKETDIRDMINSRLK